MILVSKGIHSHPPPPPSRVPLAIRSRLQDLIRQTNDNNVDVTPTNIITGNYSTSICFKRYYLMKF